MAEHMSVLFPSTTTPDKISFTKRSDGRYDMEIVNKGELNGKIFPVLSKSITRLPEWAYGSIPLEIYPQGEDKELWTMEIIEEEV
jgi:hypothetical protein